MHSLDLVLKNTETLIEWAFADTTTHPFRYDPSGEASRINVFQSLTTRAYIYTQSDRLHQSTERITSNNIKLIVSHIKKLLMRLHLCNTSLPTYIPYSIAKLYTISIWNEPPPLPSSYARNDYLRLINFFSHKMSH